MERKHKCIKIVAISRVNKKKRDSKNGMTDSWFWSCNHRQISPLRCTAAMTTLEKWLIHCIITCPCLESDRNMRLVRLELHLWRLHYCKYTASALTSPLCLFFSDRGSPALTRFPPFCSDRDVSAWDGLHLQRRFLRFHSTSLRLLPWLSRCLRWSRMS